MKQLSQFDNQTLQMMHTYASQMILRGTPAEDAVLTAKGIVKQIQESAIELARATEERFGHEIDEVTGEPIDDEEPAGK